MTREMSGSANWPPPPGQLISYKSGDGWKSGVLRAVRWGLVWRDFFLDDGRVIAETKVSGCPMPQAWRETSAVTRGEREACEERLAAMAAAGQDPREREQPFRAELNQYLAYTYLKFKRAEHGPSHTEPRLDEIPELIRDVKRVVTGRLGELLEVEGDARECESAAYSLGRLNDLEVSLQAADRPAWRGSTR